MKSTKKQLVKIAFHNKKLQPSIQKILSFINTEKDWLEGELIIIGFQIPELRPHLRPILGHLGKEG